MNLCEGWGLFLAKASVFRKHGREMLQGRGGPGPLGLPPPSPIIALPSGQWKQCCDEIMKIETPVSRKPPQVLAKQGSLYHEMGE